MTRHLPQPALFGCERPVPSALRRQRRGARLPEALILSSHRSSHRAPHIPPNRIRDPEVDDEKPAVRLAEPLR